MKRADALPHLTLITRTYAGAGQPETTFAALDTGLAEVLNLLHEEGWYDDADVPIGLACAALAVPAYLAAGSRPS